jgi:hypothetical protein
MGKAKRLSFYRNSTMVVPQFTFNNGVRVPSVGLGYVFMPCRTWARTG